jgi:hypothetical protein
MQAGDREAVRDRQSQLRHLGEVRALAAKGELHRGVALLEGENAFDVGQLPTPSCPVRW